MIHTRHSDRPTLRLRDAPHPPFATTASLMLQPRLSALPPRRIAQPVTKGAQP